jgi:hypothetical protein
MVEMKKIFPYLILNIFVSAVTMLAVILIWNAFHPGMVSFKSSDSSTFQETQIQSNTLLPPLNEKTVEIIGAFMPAEVNFEKITLKCVGNSPVDLTGWSLEDGQKHQLILPSLTLYPNGAVDVYSHAGVNTAVELFWNSNKAIWSVGEKATLFDPAGNVRSTFTIP